MKTPLDDDLRKTYEAFEQDHERLGRKLMASLPDIAGQHGRMSGPARARRLIRGTIMKSKMTKFAAAAVMIIAVVLLITFLDKSVAPAYAIEQTIEANKGLHYIHVRTLSPPAHEQQDMWMEFDENGEVIRIRVEEGRDESFRIVVWANDTIYWYSPPKNEFIIKHELMRGDGEIELMSKMVDPRYAVQVLYDLYLDGKIDIEVETSIHPDNLISLMATPRETLEEWPRVLAGADKQVLLIDPITKLAIRRDTYYAKDNQLELNASFQFMEYNNPIDPEMFVLEPPEEVELEDRAKGIGMPQGDLTDEEAAAKVVLQYIEALIAKDYETAGKLYNGEPADELREWNEEKLQITHVRVIGVGRPVPKPERGPRAYGVPFAWLIETSDGRKEISGPWGGKAWTEEAEAKLEIQNHRQAMVRPVVDQPNHWVITGGL